MDIRSPQNREIIGSAKFQEYLENLISKKYSRYPKFTREDIKQEACLNMLKPTRNVTTPWGYAKFAVPESHRTEERRQKRIGLLAGNDSREPCSREIGPLEVLAQNDEVRHILAPLLNKERACLILRICHEYTFGEIKEALELDSYGQARRMFLRIMDRLKVESRRTIQ